GPKGFTPGTGKGQTVTTTTYNLTGLSSYTAYDLYLAGNCGAGQTSVWVGPYSFVTPVQVGWVESFSAGYDPLATTPNPMLWTEGNGPATNPTVLGSNTSAWMEGGWLNNGTTGAVENAVPVASSATQGWMFTPSIDLGDVAHTTYFEWDMGMTNGGTAAGVMGLDDTVMVIISTNNGLTWNRSQAIKKYHRMSGVSPFGGRYSINLSAYTGLVEIGFYVESLASSAAHPFATSYDVHVDNVALVATQSPCLVPDVTVTPTSSTAVVSWTPSSTGGQIAWGPVGFNIGSGASGANQATASTNPFTITGLTPGTGYQVYYQTPCGATAGQWVGPFTFSTPCVSAMNGAYTVDSNGTGANNFTSLGAAVNALSVCGVSGPVTITLAGYTHTGGLNLALIPGASATNTVTFQGATAGGSVIQGTGGQFGAVVFNGTKYVTIQNLTVNAPTMSGVIFTGGAEYITIHNNSILADTVSTSSTIAAIASTASLTSVSSYGNNADHITITDNVVKGGYYGIRFNGTSTTVRNSDINISGNTVAKAYYYGIYTYYVDGIKFNDNVVDNFRNSFNYAIYAYYVNGAEVQRNVTNSYYQGLLLGYLNNTAKPAVNSLVANNMFNATGSYGAYFPYPRYLNMYYNTMKGSSYGCYMLTSTTTLQAKVL
ncbi:MAG: fibronectin type III domain-containing protein, partial [Schleiferiaceae bacterium]